MYNTIYSFNSSIYIRTFFLVDVKNVKTAINKSKKKKIENHQDIDYDSRSFF